MPSTLAPPSSPREVSIVVVSFNTKEMTLACIESVLTETRKHTFEIIVVDNNSSDGSVDAITQRFPGVVLIPSTENLGFARGNNLAVGRARGQRILLLNPDTLVTNGAIDALIDFANSSPKSRLWGGRAVFPDGAVNASCWNDMTLWSLLCRASGLTWLFPRFRLFNPETIHAWDPLSSPRDADIVVGCFLLIDKQLWDDLNGFDPLFYMYGDEVDLCLRARKLGARPRVTPSATIVHFGGASEPSSEDKLVKVWKGRATVMREHWTPLCACVGRFTMVAAAAVRALGSALLHPPHRQGSGLDQKANVWPTVFRRRKEWSRGWQRPSSPTPSHPTP